MQAMTRKRDFRDGWSVDRPTFLPALTEQLIDYSISVPCSRVEYFAWCRVID